MELIRGLHNLRPQHHGCVATIGNFDGVHLGHQHVLEQLATKAKQFGCPSTVITFEPQPLEYFAGGAAPARLMRLRDKVNALRRYKVGRILSLRFNKALADMPYQEFIERVLVKGLGVRYLVVGDDFRFGKGREGTFAHLVAAGKQHQFEVVHMPTFNVGTDTETGRVSSTRIRTALEAGQFKKAEKLLGHHYKMTGRVAHGEKLGRELGFPTANIHIHRKVTPLHGIYVVTVEGLNDLVVEGVASIGTRPVVNGKKVILEVFLFDFNESIYGEQLEVSFLKKLRDELPFDSLDELKVQIVIDVEQAKDFFKQH
ncbi:FMN adenylyltransferase / Riboflavin kinase [hydrothermal vent metagenome]|uniref:Bifunctional riboflavin kinase/FMN adenylyltransferase n=1 Tax=hydrothermal vent metagenome TaxID=652676 RepID=A0A3B1ADN3_9ZZZZ